LKYECTEKEFEELMPLTIELQATTIHKIKLRSSKLWSLGIVNAPKYLVSLAWKKKSPWEYFGEWLGCGRLEIIEQPIGILIFRFTVRTEKERHIFEFTIPKLDIERKFIDINPEEILVLFNSFWKKTKSEVEL